MRRVVITGSGIVSSIGTGTQEVCDSLYHGKSGIETSPEQIEIGFRSHVSGRPRCDIDSILDRKTRRFMGQGTAWAFIAMQEAIKEAGLEKNEISNERTGIIMGSGGSSTRTIVENANAAKERGVRKVSPTAVPKAMSSTNVAAPSMLLEIKGVNYSISSACATSVHCIGHAAQLVQWNLQDIVFAGGGEDLDWTLSVLFDAMGAMSSKFNDTPAKASRPYDKNRDGLVIAGGGGAVIVEELEHAKARGANILAEIVGFGATSDGQDMVQPSPDGMARAMEMAKKNLDCAVDYINPHATSTPIGDAREAEALRKVFGDKIPPLSATKALTGHSMGATGVQEIIYCLLMMKKDFIAPSVHIEELDPIFSDLPIQQKRVDQAGLNCVMSNSFGFGGTNGVLALKRYS
jgi:3-oxoacyl-[acyl-carrier-protein] synthase-1